MGFALKSRPSLMISVAEYLEEKGELEKAVQLYQKAGEITKALDLCFRAGAGAEEGQQDGGRAGERNPAMFEALKSMMDDLGSHASPQARFWVAPCAYTCYVNITCFFGRVRWILFALEEGRLSPTSFPAHVFGH